MDQGREGHFKGGRYPEEGTGQYTVYSQTIHNAALALETLVLLYKLKIVNRYK